MNGTFNILSGLAIALFLFRSNKPATSTATVRQNVLSFRGIAKRFADIYNLPETLILAIIHKESGGNPNARGANGEKGLMQVKDIAVKDVWENETRASFDPETNIRHGVAFLQVQINRCGSIFDGLKCYNQGQKGAKENPVIAENYANDVLRIKKNYDILLSETSKSDGFLFL